MARDAAILASRLAKDTAAERQEGVPGELRTGCFAKHGRAEAATPGGQSALTEPKRTLSRERTSPMATRDAASAGNGAGASFCGANGKQP